MTLPGERFLSDEDVVEIFTDAFSAFGAVQEACEIPDDLRQLAFGHCLALIGKRKIPATGLQIAGGGVNDLMQ